MEESIELNISAISACSLWRHDCTAIRSVLFEAVAPDTTRVVVWFDLPNKGSLGQQAVEDAHLSALAELQRFKEIVETHQSSFMH